MIIQKTPVSNLIKMTDCLPKCKYTKYDYEEETNKEVRWKTDWKAVFYLMPLPMLSSLENRVEEYEFGYSELLADFGSYLGLFLGWSLLSISRDIPLWYTWVKKTFNLYREKKVFFSFL